MHHIALMKEHCSDKSASYSGIAKVGQGTFGRVYYAKNIRQERLAIKQLMRLDRERECVCAGREIQILRGLNHPNVIRLLDVCLWGNKDETPKLSLVFEFCAHNLHDLIHKSGKRDRFTFAEKKTIMRGILTGVEYIHSFNIVHRDLKPANILITEYGEVKVADLGLARAMYRPSPSPDEPEEYMSPGCFTFGYRPPEVVLGCQDYGKAVDMWSVAFIFTELLFRGSFNAGLNTNRNELRNIVNLCGPLFKDTWPGIDKSPNYFFYEYALADLKDCSNFLLASKEFSGSFPDLYAFLFFWKLVRLNPSERMTASIALGDEMFNQEPKPVALNHTTLVSPHL